MPDGGFKVEVEALRRYRDTLEDFKSQADTFSDLVDRADVGDESWGLVGLATKSSYTEALGQLRDLLDRMKQGLTNTGEKFTKAAELYASNDDQGAIQLGNYEIEVDKVDEVRPAGA
ncbi:type VII secretion target [Saccharomonospora viridis]|jgi:hypothetical protein|uniref:Excreted virulence factor EspC, type VII ESX diderm n=1 Tax=Saccharomonospora viridis (strain ATCC 15386 / DSM 43017 / JCM 3036 / CCUG 5913 / NBRC 12207 / NCIMB 9602 / P101) TaxID=471857 RepID=C7MTJ3_SACVD|nr:type VII secretion target [Saccharomonospora viridis]ACU95463.1 hypothetical protein Svir_03860 [Saccharomonospora viridis DSM 43017]